MRVQKASPEDHPGILRLYLQFNEDRVRSGVGDAQYSAIAGELPWKNTLTDPQCMTYVIKEEGAVVGFITMRLLQFNPFGKMGRVAEIDLLVVDKRLRRKGIGSALFKGACSSLYAFGVSNLLLNVKVGNSPAMLFWSHLGFRNISKTEYTRTDGMQEKTVYMMKKL
jgi:ribosomal protein S18 acetylase RimI-like enzyme